MALDTLPLGNVAPQQQPLQQQQQQPRWSRRHLDELRDMSFESQGSARPSSVTWRQEDDEIAKLNSDLATSWKSPVRRVSSTRTDVTKASVSSFGEVPASQGSSVSGVRTAVSRASSIAVIKAQSSFLLTFNGEPGLFRGVPLSSVLRNCGRIWSKSSGCENTYALSHQVTTLRTFISHNWAVGRFRKWVALCLHFNLPLAGVGLLIASAFLCSLHIFGAIPCIDDHEIGRDEDHPLPTGFAVRMAAGFIFFVLLLFGRNIATIFGIMGPDVFLDKVCIHQTDRAVQRRGIVKLGAFLRHSDEMLVLYTNMYLLKLWTIFEVAAFLLLHPVQKMKVVPVNLAVLYCVAVFVGSLGPAGVVICRMAEVTEAYGLAFSHLAGYFYVYFLREWHRDKTEMKERLCNFTVHDALCAVESDRPLVLDNIVAMMKAHRKVDYEASRYESLAAFDKLVRTELPLAFSSALGHYISFSYGQVLVMSFVSSWSMAFDLLGGLGEAGVGQQMGREIVIGFCNYLVWGLIVFPVFWAFREYLASFNLHWRGWKGIAWVCFAQIVPGLMGFPLLYLVNRLRDRAYESDVAFAFVLASSITFCTFGSYGVSLLFSIGEKTSRAPNDRFIARGLPKEDPEVAPKVSTTISFDLQTHSDEGGHDDPDVFSM